MTQTFTYGVTRVSELRPETVSTQAGYGIKSITIGDKVCLPTERFYRSLCQRFAFSRNIFTYFTPDEVFNRVYQKVAKDRIRYCIETEKDGSNRLLAVSNPESPILYHQDLMELLSGSQSESVSYHGGTLSADRRLRHEEAPFAIGPDAFRPGYVVNMPIDGFGKPVIHLKMLRLVCQNGMVGYTEAFRSEIAMGKGDDGLHNLRRALESYNNEEGFAAMRTRMEGAQKSWASVGEAMRLQSILGKMFYDDSLHLPELEGRGITFDDDSQRYIIEENVPVFREFYKMIGNVRQHYGLANLNVLSAKKQRALPVSCRVFDLINFASEVATHRADIRGARRLYAYLGELLGSEYDLEGTAEKVKEFTDFFTMDRNASKARDLVRDGYRLGGDDALDN